MNKVWKQQKSEFRTPLVCFPVPFVLNFTTSDVQADRVNDNKKENKHKNLIGVV